MSVPTTSSMVVTQGRACEPGARSFDEIVDRSFESLLRFAMGLVGERESAEDIVQEALLLVWQQGAALESHPDYIASRLQREVLVLCRSERRARARYTQLYTQLPQEQEEEEVEAPWEEVEQAVVQEESPYISIVAQLPARHRRVLEMRFLAGMSSSEMADALGVSQRVLKLRVREAVACIKRRLHDARLVEQVFFSGTPQDWGRAS